jgi:formate hydrogenlyase transcriptional activator
MPGDIFEADFHLTEQIQSSDDPDRLIATYFQSSTVGLCVLDPELRYISINNALARIHGVAAEQHVGQSAREILGSAADQLEPEFRRVFQTGRPNLNLEMVAVFPASAAGGHRIKHIFPIKDESGTTTRILVVVFEVSKERKLQTAVKELDTKLRREKDLLQSLLDISGLLSSNWDVPAVFPMISARIRRVLRQELASFALYDGESGTLTRQSIDFPLSKGLLARSPMSVKNTPAWPSLQKRRSIIFSKKELQAFKAEIAQSLIEEGVQSFCCVPMMRPKGPLGVLFLGSTREDAFQADDLQLLNQVATQLALAIENHRAASEIVALKERLGDEGKLLEADTKTGGEFPEIVGNSRALKQVLDQIATVAASEATVLILGETGTGKELIARAIHRLSRRNAGNFIKLNCAAIPTGLLESELFGHERGAFTGAINQKVGRMELADGGTLFLDEIGEIPLELQPKLLRVLQDQEFERLGSNRTLKVNVRLLAATNRDLAEAIAHHHFRSDLYYRLSVFPIMMPPLRDRPEDIPLLVRHFVRKFASRMNRYIELIPTNTVQALQQWDWPGNVRELENLMERAVILSEGHSLRVPLSELSAFSSKAGRSEHNLDDAERKHIIRVLLETRGVLSGPEGAAKRLGMKRTTLQSRMERLKITRKDYSDPASEKA